jgi:hypothetical protein
VATVRARGDARGRRCIEVVQGGSQLELIGTESDDWLYKNIRPWDAINKMEFDGGAELSPNFYEPTKIDA